MQENLGGVACLGAKLQAIEIPRGGGNFTELDLFKGNIQISVKKIAHSRDFITLLLNRLWPPNFTILTTLR